MDQPRNTPHYTQLQLWEHDGEVFTGSAPEGADAVQTYVPYEVTRQWEETARLAAQRQREMFAYYDTASAVSGT